ncbi:MAG: RidA family protein [Candidatus Limiplasma sp.]|nr:RidA family protein [Candidatus Limiplasma sp.]
MKQIQIPDGAAQHVTAGPYSPVLEVRGGAMVILSGQAAIDMEGNVVGETIQEQTRVTLENCRRLLGSSGCGFSDVFKVTVYLRDLADWPRFNQVYSEIMPRPLPTRTAVQVGLLDNLLVEVEMWAVKE